MRPHLNADEGLEHGVSASATAAAGSERREQELERGHEPPAPVRLFVAAADLFVERERLSVLVALAPEYAGELSRITQSPSTLVGTDVEVEASGRGAVRLDVGDERSSG